MVSVEEYKPTAEFQEDVKDPLLEIPMIDSTELWLIQWPINQPPDFDGQEVLLKLHEDGELGNFENSSGTYKMVNYATQEPDATVFQSPSSESKIVSGIEAMEPVDRGRGLAADFDGIESLLIDLVEFDFPDRSRTLTLLLTFDGGLILKICVQPQIKKKSLQGRKEAWCQ